jgi:phage terminase large subunit
MAQILLKLNKEMFVPKLFPYLLDYSHRWEFWVGSAGSGKSYTICQKIIVRCTKEKLRVLVCRRYGTTLRQSVVKQFNDVLTQWKLTKYVKMRQTDFTITFPNGSEIIFSGLDDEEKLLSLTNISMIWVEEAYQVEKNKVEQLNLRMRGTAANQQLILSWNPINKGSWLYNFTVENPPENSVYIHSCYKDNPFLNDEYRRAIDEMAVRNPAKYRVFGLGEWGVDSEGLVYTNWIEEEFDALEMASKGLEHRAGMDIGFVDPSTVVDTLYDRENRTIYVFNEFYKKGCQLNELAEAIKKMNLQRTILYVDAADPRAIQFFRNEGIRAEQCKKGGSKGSVQTGIQFLQDHKLIIHPKCKEVIRELENYSYIRSKQTGEWTDDTTHEYSHSLDGLRYAYSDIYTSQKINTYLSKDSFGF